MSEINNLITPHNIQSELIKNEIEQNNLMVETVKEQKYNELLRENHQLKDRINKAVDYINWWVEDNKKQEIGLTISETDGLLSLLKGDKE